MTSIDKNDAFPVLLSDDMTFLRQRDVLRWAFYARFLVAINYGSRLLSLLFVISLDMKRTEIVLSDETLTKCLLSVGVNKGDNTSSALSSNSVVTISIRFTAIN